MGEEARKNDELILYKLDELKTDLHDLGSRLDSHIVTTDHAINGNGTAGLKSTVAELKTKITVTWVFLSTAIVAIINDYIFRTGGH